MGIGAAAAEIVMPENAAVTYLPHQVAPKGEDWEGWMLMGGRGAGKSHALTGYLRDEVIRNPTVRARIIGPTLTDIINSDVYGPAGILAKDPTCEFRPSAAGGAALKWPSGAECLLIGCPSLREVDRLRATGNRELDLWEEGAAIPVLERAWEQAELGRRVGRPRWVMATTPRARQLLRDLLKSPKVVHSYAASGGNPYNSPEWLARLEKTYKGTRLYRQEVLGEILDDVEGALWKQAWLDIGRVEGHPELVKVAVGVDPANTTGTTGIVVAGVGVDGVIYILEDLSQRAVTAETWADVATKAAIRWDAPIIAENDSGGDAIRAVLKASSKKVVVKPATARKIGGKQTRAVPVALLWERDDVGARMAGDFPMLEEELTTWEPDVSRDSPDRLDAMVWACTYLMGQRGWEDTTFSMPGDSQRRKAAAAANEGVHSPVAGARVGGSLLQFNRKRGG